MSVQEFSDRLPPAGEPRDVEPERRPLWLTLSALLGPVAALANQQATYSVTPWACGQGARATLHIAPALCLALVIVTGLFAHRHAGRGADNGKADADRRIGTVRFLAIVGMGTSILSAMIIAAQWFAVIMFDPCLRA